MSGINAGNSYEIVAMAVKRMQQLDSGALQ
jgi:hypothetical protein